MATLNTPATALLGLGADAMDNMFDIQIDLPESVSAFGIPTTLGGSPSITIRADGFSPPEFTIKTYPIAYKAVKIDRPATKIDGERQFEITFRLDANYEAYKSLGAWRSLLMEPSSGYATNALFGQGGDVSVAAGASNNVFGTVKIAALNRPIHMTTGNAFEVGGVTSGKFTDEPSANNVIWEFYNVWLSKLEEPKYKTDGGDAIKIKATFKFGDYVNPIYTNMV